MRHGAKGSTLNTTDRRTMDNIAPSSAGTDEPQVIKDASGNWSGPLISRQGQVSQLREHSTGDWESCEKKNARRRTQGELQARARAPNLREV